MDIIVLVALTNFKDILLIFTHSASLIELLAEVLDAEQSLFGKKVRPVEDWLKRYLKSGFVLRYERRKEIAHDETVLTSTAHPFVLTPTLVCFAEQLTSMCTDFVF